MRWLPEISLCRKIGGKYDLPPLFQNICVRTEFRTQTKTRTQTQFSNLRGCNNNLVAKRAGGQFLPVADEALMLYGSPAHGMPYHPQENSDNRSHCSRFVLCVSPPHFGLRIQIDAQHLRPRVRIGRRTIPG